jgi:AcrR family transcriptional regulator
MSVSRPKESRGAKTRQRIIEQSASVFNQRGYAGTALSDLMDATGLKKGGIYRHFANKEELAAEAFKFAWAKSFAPRIDGLRAAASSREALSRVVANFVHRIPQGILGGCPLMNAAVDADDTNPHLFALARRALSDWRKRIEKIVREGQRRGELRKDLAPAEVANTLIGSLEGALLICRVEGSREMLLAAEKHLDAYIQTLAPAAKLRAGVRRNTARRAVR